ncbi:MAG TPA: alpha/beta hydrolase [Rhodospirillales bacterium]|nr:alpha/beta hydrolase [Rhodospirillales bacterium]
MTETRTAMRDDGATIAYHHTPGKSPGVMFLTGFMSDMTGGKALHLEEYCRKQGRAFLRFDYQGHGASSGAFKDGTISGWTEDAVFALDALAEGPQILVGSSMGGWIMLLAALQRPERVAGLLGIAAAPDFTENIIENKLTAEQKETIERDGFISMPSDYDDSPYIITKALLEDGRNNLLLNKPIPLTCPVRLIHGVKDADAPWRTSLRISEMLTSGDVELTLVKEGGHRLSEPADLDRLTRNLEALIGAS